LINSVTVKVAAELLGLSVRRVQQLCGEGVFVGAQKIKGEWLIPADSRPIFLRQGGAANRLTILQQLDAFITASKKHGGGKRRLVEAFAKQRNIPLRTLWRWRANYQRYGILGLVDSRGRSNEAQIEIEVRRVEARIELGQILIDSLRRRDREQLLSLINSGEVRKDEVQRIVRKLLRRKES
jgi:hypothetical protein